MKELINVRECIGQMKPDFAIEDTVMFRKIFHVVKDILITLGKSF